MLAAGAVSDDYAITRSTSRPVDDRRKRRLCISAGQPYPLVFSPVLPEPHEAQQLRDRAADGEKKSKLAKEFGISRETVYSYLRAEPAAESRSSA